MLHRVLKATKTGVIVYTAAHMPCPVRELEDHLLETEIIHPSQIYGPSPQIQITSSFAGQPIIYAGEWLSSGD